MARCSQRPGNWPNRDGRWKAQIAQFGRSETVDRGNLHAGISAAMRALASPPPITNR